jgi:hypothetical protein
MTVKKPSSEEEEYFAREEAQKRHKLAVEKSAAMKAEEKEALKKLHFMRCPSCGMQLEKVQFHGITIDRCFSCGGTFLDAGELEHLAGKEHGVIAKIVALFK